MSCTQLFDEELFDDDTIQALDYSSYIDKVDFDEAKALSDTLDQYKIIVTEAEREEKLTNDSFKQGGVNKKVHRETGTLRADTEVGVEDFARETELAEYAEDKPELAFYTSFQRIIDTPEGLDTQYTYAEFDIYNKNNVASTELVGNILFLDRDDALDIALQMIEVANVMYSNRLSHRDLHMGNLIIHRIKGSDESFLKVIDFGRVKYGKEFEPYRYNDIRYLFKRKGESFGETFARNYLVPNSSDIAKKHYPLHKLIDPYGDSKNTVRSVLSKVGSTLHNELKLAKANEQNIGLAFTKAKCSVAILFGYIDEKEKQD